MPTYAQVVIGAKAKTKVNTKDGVDEFIENFTDFDNATYFYDLDDLEYSKDPTNSGLITKIEERKQILQDSIREIENGPKFHDFLKCLNQQKENGFDYYKYFYEEFKQSRQSP